MATRKGRVNARGYDRLTGDDAENVAATRALLVRRVGRLLDGLRASHSADGLETVDRALYELDRIQQDARDYLQEYGLEDRVPCLTEGKPPMEMTWEKFIGS